MSQLEKDTEILSEFGLTPNQAKVYMAVVQLGLASVGQVSKAAKVRREDVYRILPKLEEMGLVERLLGTPVRIRATPVEEALSILVKHTQNAADEKLATLKARREQFLKYLKANKRKTQSEGEETNFSLLAQRDGILGKTITMMKNAEKKIDIVYSRNKLSQFIYTFAEQLKTITRKGVKIRIISELPEYEDAIPRIIEEYISPGISIDLRYTDLPISHYIIVDFKQALLSTTTEGNLGETCCLWTNSNSLVGLMQKNFEDLWHTSMNWKTIETNAIPEKMINFVEQLRPSNHVIFFYNSQEAKHSILFNYLKVGLENGEAAAYVASEESSSEIRDAMKQLGIDVEKYEKTGALSILGYKDAYIIDGKFDVSTTMGFWNRLYKEALTKGFKGLRVTGETACFFKHNLTQELIEYERVLHRILDIPMIAICAYNANLLNKTNDPVNLCTELVKAHGTVLFTGIDNKLGRIEIRKG